MVLDLHGLSKPAAQSELLWHLNLLTSDSESELLPSKDINDNDAGTQELTIITVSA
jgi:hypothetical protein